MHWGGFHLPERIETGPQVRQGDGWRSLSVPRAQTWLNFEVFHTCLAVSLTKAIFQKGREHHFTARLTTQQPGLDTKLLFWRQFWRPSRALCSDYSDWGVCVCVCVRVCTCLGVAVHTSKPLQRGLGSPREQESLLFCRDGLGCYACFLSLPPRGRNLHCLAEAPMALWGPRGPLRPSARSKRLRSEQMY